MEKLTIKTVAQYLLSHDSYIIVTHRRPDGDTAGCGALLCRALRQLGKTAAILKNPQLTARYAPYHEGLTVEEIPAGATVVTVDVAGREMLPTGLAETEIHLLLDHHGSNPGFAHRGIVDHTAAACGELVWDVLQEMGVKLDKPMAEALYVALSTDTGCFRYSNTTARTLRTAALCLETGMDAYPINKALFETVRLPRLRLNSYMARNLELLKNGEVALVAIPGPLEQELGITEEDMEDVSNFARNIEGVELAVTFRTVAGGNTKLSVRSSPRYDAAALCAPLGGGGHKAAAGATVHGDQEVARQKVLDIMMQQGILA